MTGPPNRSELLSTQANLGPVDKSVGFGARAGSGIVDKNEGVGVQAGPDTDVLAVETDLSWEAESHDATNISFTDAQASTTQGL